MADAKGSIQQALDKIMINTDSLLSVIGVVLAVLIIMIGFVVVKCMLKKASQHQSLKTALLHIDK